MKLNNIMEANVKTIGPSATLRDAALLMKNESIGMLPVVDKNKVIGVLTDRDIVVRGLTTGSEQQRVRDIMTHNPVTLKPQDDTETAIKEMARHKIGRLILVDGEHQLAGVVSATDIASAAANPRSVNRLVKTLGRAHKEKERPLTKA